MAAYGIHVIKVMTLHVNNAQQKSYIHIMSSRNSWRSSCMYLSSPFNSLTACGNSHVFWHVLAVYGTRVLQAWYWLSFIRNFLLPCCKVYETSVLISIISSSDIYWNVPIVHVINSMWPSNTIWPHRSRSALAQVMACCLWALSLCTNEFRLIINGVLWH